MNPEAQRIAIAEACGWKNQRYSPSSEYEMWCNPQGVPIGFLPDYLSDLNAMHEAEKVLTAKQRRVFGDNLNNIVDAFYDDYYQGWVGTIGFAEAVFDIAHADAAQHAKAFLKTLNSWNE